MELTKECALLKEYFPLSEFGNHANNPNYHGPLDVDGIRRNKISDEGRKIVNAAENNLRVRVEGKLIKIGNPKHPNNSLYVKYKEEMKQKYPKEYPPWRTLKVYKKIYKHLGILYPTAKGKKNGNASLGEIACMDYLNVKDRQVRINPYYVDGIKKDIIYEYNGDYYHGNPSLYSSTDKLFNGTYEEKWERDLKKYDFLESQSYSVNIIWESDWQLFSNKKCDRLKIYSLEEYKMSLI